MNNGKQDFTVLQGFTSNVSAMSSQFDALLDATIEQLHVLKKSGVQFVRVDGETLQSLAKPVIRRVAPVVSKAPKTALPTSASVHTSAQVAGTGSKEARMAELQCQVLKCFQCQNLAASRKSVVFGVGNIHSELMFVGEAPGADEDVAGEPFVGKAGQLLTKIIVAMGYKRESVYIANILKCRPDTPGQVSGNRKPTPEEMQTCLPYLLQQIEIINPKVIVALGGTALEGLFGKTAGIMRLRGNWQTFQGIPVMPTYHPAFLLRNESNTEKRKVWEDMLQVLEKLNQPISEKQRGFFRKSG